MCRALTLHANTQVTCFGPGVGGLFLAFPAIFPASASLIESHEIKRKAKVGSDGRNRGRLAASLDSQGASLGCIGLMGFAFVLWAWLNSHKCFAHDFLSSSDLANNRVWPVGGPCEEAAWDSTVTPTLVELIHAMEKAKNRMIST
jgi:hypothetical protein